MAGADPEASSRIFISYRREDSSGHVLALLPALRGHFGSDRIFKDTDNIPPGADFLKFIKNELESCSVLLAIIGREWLNIQDPRLKTRRLDNPDDFLRVEVASALKNERIRVIPVLIERAAMPSAQDLPSDLNELAFRNAIELSDVRWDSDIRLLIDAIEHAAAESAAKPQAPTRPGLQDLQKRRAREIASQLANARQAFESGDFEGTLWACDKALLLDPHLPEVLDLMDRARKAIDEQKINGWLEEARRALAQGDISKASDLIDQALAVDRDSQAALTIRGEMLELRRERERERERARTVQAATDRARASFDEGDFEATVRHADDALAVESGYLDAMGIKTKALTALEERRRQRDLKRREAAEEARREELRRADEQAQRVAAERALTEKKAREDEERRQKERQEQEARRLAEERAAQEQRRRDEQRRKKAEEEEEARRLAAENERTRKEAEATRLAAEAQRAKEAAEARASQAAAATAPKPVATDENVQFTVFRRSAIQPENWYPLLVFAHLAERRADAPDDPDPLEEVQAQARQLLGDDIGKFRAATEDSGYPVARQGELRFVPHMEGVTFNPPERRFLWTESVHREDFRLRADKSMDGHVARGAVSVFYGNLLLAEVQLSIKVDRKSTASHHEETHARPYRRIFASYSHRDTAIVEEFESHAVATGDRYLRDVVTLRAGEVWDERLLEIIKQADVFQLFWSWNALSSPLVREEWRQALALNRPHFVRPVYWEEPLPEQAGLPPIELRRLHFQRVYPRVSSQPARLPVPMPSPAVEALPPPQRAPISRLISYGSAAAVLVGAVGLYFTVLQRPPAVDSTISQVQSKPPSTIELPSAAPSGGSAATAPPPVQNPAVSVPPAVTANPPSSAVTPAPPVTTAPPSTGGTARRGSPPPRGGASAAVTTAKPSTQVTPAPMPTDPVPPPVSKTPAIETPPAVITKEPVENPPPPVVASKPPPVEAAKPPVADRFEEERRIRGALERYESAYDNLDAGAVRALYPGAPANLAATFADYQFYRLEVVVQKITLAPDLQSATAVARLSHFFQPRVGRSQDYQRTQEFTFEKRGNSWTIARIR